MSNPSELRSESPYLVARREWNERYGSYLAQARNWRLAALGAILVSAILATGLVWLSQQSQIIPYIVEIDKLGRVVAVHRAEQTNLSDPRLLQGMITTKVSEFIEWTRIVSIDRPRMKADISRAYAMSEAPVQAYLSEYYQRLDPFKRAEKETVEVQLTLVLPVGEPHPSRKSYQAEWTETVRDFHGRTLGQTRWQAQLILSLTNQPRSQEDLLIHKNSLGIYVASLSWTQKL